MTRAGHLSDDGIRLRRIHAHQRHCGLTIEDDEEHGELEIPRGCEKGRSGGRLEIARDVPTDSRESRPNDQGSDERWVADDNIVDGSCVFSNEVPKNESRIEVRCSEHASCIAESPRGCRSP